MTSTPRSTQLAILGLAAALITGGVGALLPPASIAQTGLTIFGGIEPEYRLRYLIDRNHVRSTDARYYLRVSGDKLLRDVISLEIDYPPDFVELQGEFNENEIELRKGGGRGGDVISTRSVAWLKDEARIEIIPEEPIPEGTEMVIVLSDVNNPRRYGYHYFNLRLMYQGDVVSQYVGTWPLEVAVDSTRDD